MHARLSPSHTCIRWTLLIDDVLEEQSSDRTNRRSARRWLTSGVVVALLVAMAVHVSRRHEELAYVQRLSIQVLIVTCALQFVSQIFLNGSLLLPLQTCVKKLGFWELYLVRTGGFFVGSLVPVAGGLAVRLAYLRSRGLTYLDFTWATLFSNVLALGAAAVLAVGATGVLWMTAGPPPALVLGVSAGVLAISVAALAAFEFLPRLTRHPKLQKWRWLSGMSSLKTSRRMAMWVFALSLVRHVLNFVTFGLLCQSLSRVPADFLTGGLVYALTSPVRMVNITPGNLGVTEWFVAFVGKVLAFDLTTGLIVALAFRGVALVAQGLGALFGSAWLALWSRP
jgi:MFS family permease